METLRIKNDSSVWAAAGWGLPLCFSSHFNVCFYPLCYVSHFYCPHACQGVASSMKTTPSLNLHKLLTFTRSLRYGLSLFGAVRCTFLLRPPALRSIPCIFFKGRRRIWMRHHHHWKIAVLSSETMPSCLPFCNALPLDFI